MTPRLPSTVLVAALSLLSSACSLVLDTDRHQGQEAIPPERICERLARVTCEAHERCCAAEPSFNVETCVQNGAVECANDLGTIALDPRVGYDAAAAGQVLAEAEQLALDCDPTFDVYITSEEATGQVVPGTLQPGEACPTLLQGQTAGLFVCQGDDICLPDDRANLFGTWSCVERVPLGSPCQLDDECQVEDRCSVLLQGGNNGRCEPRKVNGRSCLRDAKCVSAVCDGVCVSPTVEQAYCGG